MGTEDVKLTAMNMYKYKEGLRLCKRLWRTRVIFMERWALHHNQRRTYKMGVLLRSLAF